MVVVLGLDLHRRPQLLTSDFYASFLSTTDSGNVVTPEERLRRARRSEKPSGSFYPIPHLITPFFQVEFHRTRVVDTSTLRCEAATDSHPRREACQILEQV